MCVFYFIYTLKVCKLSGLLEMLLITLGISDSNLRNSAMKDTDCSYLEGGTLLAAADEANTTLLYFYNDSLVQKLVGFRDNLGAPTTIKSVRRQCNF